MPRTLELVLRCTKSDRAEGVSANQLAVVLLTKGL